MAKNSKIFLKEQDNWYEIKTEKSIPKRSLGIKIAIISIIVDLTLVSLRLYMLFSNIF